MRRWKPSVLLKEKRESSDKKREGKWRPIKVWEWAEAEKEVTATHLFFEALSLRVCIHPCVRVCARARVFMSAASSPNSYLLHPSLRLNCSFISPNPFFFFTTSHAPFCGIKMNYSCVQKREEGRSSAISIFKRFAMNGESGGDAAQQTELECRMKYIHIKLNWNYTLEEGLSAYTSLSRSLRGF